MARSRPVSVASGWKETSTHTGVECRDTQVTSPPPRPPPASGTRALLACLSFLPDGDCFKGREGVLGTPPPAFVGHLLCSEHWACLHTYTLVYTLTSQQVGILAIPVLYMKRRPRE